jgi:hypothetical protein
VEGDDRGPDTAHRQAAPVLYRRKRAVLHLDRGALISILFFGVTGGAALGACRLAKSFSATLSTPSSRCIADDVIERGPDRPLGRMLPWHKADEFEGGRRVRL